MKIPRDISGTELAKLLESIGYSVTRVSGSHLRLTTNIKGTHHITIPSHHPIKVGTLSAILNSIANHLEITKSQLIDQLFVK